MKGHVKIVLYEELIAELQSITCHMESHSVFICHLTRVNAPHLNYSHIGWYSIYQYTGEMKSSVDFGVVYLPRWFTCPQTVTHPSTNHLIASQLGVEPTTSRSLVRHQIVTPPSRLRYDTTTTTTTITTTVKCYVVCSRDIKCMR